MGTAMQNMVKDSLPMNSLSDIVLHKAGLCSAGWSEIFNLKQVCTHLYMYVTVLLICK